MWLAQERPPLEVWSPVRYTCVHCMSITDDETDASRSMRAYFFFQVYLYADLLGHRRTRDMCKIQHQNHFEEFELWRLRHSGNCSPRTAHTYPPILFKQGWVFPEWFRNMFREHLGNTACSLFPVPCSLFPVPLRIPPPNFFLRLIASGGPRGVSWLVPCSLFPVPTHERTCVPCSLFP